MRWFVLKDRRYEGPYNLEEIQAAVSESRISGHDFIISEENRKSNPLAFEKVSDLLGESYVPPPKKIEPVSKPKENKNKEALSKEFEESFDSKDLIKSKDSIVEQIRYDKSAEEIYMEESTKSPAWLWLKKQQNAVVVIGAIVFLSGSFLFLFLAGEKNSQLTQLGESKKQAAKPLIPSKKSAEKLLGKERGQQVKLPQVQRREVEEVDLNQEVVDISEENSFQRPALNRDKRRRRGASRVIADERSRDRSLSEENDPFGDERSYELDDGSESDYDNDYADDGYEDDGYEDDGYDDDDDFLDDEDDYYEDE
jgi:hypothetical protein